MLYECMKPGRILVIKVKLNSVSDVSKYTDFTNLNVSYVIKVPLTRKLLMSMTYTQDYITSKTTRYCQTSIATITDLE